jgi:hypothetical protein
MAKGYIELVDIELVEAMMLMFTWTKEPTTFGWCMTEPDPG